MVLLTIIKVLAGLLKLPKSTVCPAPVDVIICAPDGTVIMHGAPPAVYK